MESNKKRTIKIKARGSLSLAPDTIEINMEVEAKDLAYEKAMEKAGLDLEKIRISLKGQGFEKKDIKTRNFNVETKYENVRNNRDEYVRKFIGYRISNRLKIEFEEDPLKLGRVLNALASSGSNPQMSIAYKLRDRKEVDRKLLEKAIGEAREKAEIIARSSGVRLLDIVKIDYGSKEIEFHNQAIQFSRAMPLGDSEMIDLEAGDLEFSDSVTIEWEIS